MPETRFAFVSRGTAALILAATLMASVVWAVASVGAAPAGSAGKEGNTDLDLYEAIVGQMRDGDSYYSAAHEELTERGYPSRSVFNWRTPAYAKALSSLPSDTVAQVLLALLAGGTAVLAIYVLARQTGRWGLYLGSFALPLTLLFAFLPRTVMLAELTAGVLILLSLCLHSLGRTWAAVLCGAVALFVRELTGLYIVVAACVAIKHRRWAEFGSWLGVLALYAAYFLWHRSKVLGILDARDQAADDGWLQLGGPMFSLRTAQMDGVMLLLPLAVVGVVLPFMVLGLIGWKGDGSALAAITVVAYLVAFCFVGKPVNAYWGSMYTPLLAFGLVMAAPAIKDLLSQVRGPRRAPERSLTSGAVR